MFKKRINLRQLGKIYEEEAANNLKERGMTIIEKNYTCPVGEMDLIAKHGYYLVFVEVRYRDFTSGEYSYESIRLFKQKRLRKIARYYISTHEDCQDMPCRFDVMGFDATYQGVIESYFEDAF